MEEEVATAKHGGGNPGHDGLRLDVQVAVDLVGAPAPDEADAICANAPAQQGHGAARAGRAGGEILRSC